MALLRTEFFSKYASGNTGYNNIGSDNDNVTATAEVTHVITSGTGRFGGNVLKMGDDGDALIFPLTGLSGVIVIVGIAVKMTIGVAPATIDELIDITTSANARHAGLHFSYDGSLHVIQSGTTQIGTCFNAIKNGIWHYIEFVVNCANSGTATVYVDGVQVGSFSGDTLNTSTSIDQVRLMGLDGSGSSTNEWEDLIIMDGSGASFNAVLGDMRYEVQIPDADGGTVQWAASAGSNFQCIDDALGAYNDDTDYILESTNNDVNLASHANVSATNYSAIHFAALTVLARNETAATHKLALRAFSNATGADSADFTLTATSDATGYRWKTNHWFVDPDTTGAWTPTIINAATWGVKLRP